MLKTNRGFWKYFFLTIITLGIYGFYTIYKMAQEANLVKENGVKDVGGLLFYILMSIITLGIYIYYWNYRVNTIFADNITKNGGVAKFDGGKYLLWALLGSIIIIGPIVALVKELHLWNASNEIYNSTHPQLDAAPEENEKIKDI